MCFLVHVKFFWAKRKYTSIYHVEAKVLRSAAMALCMMQADRKKSAIAGNCNFRHICFNFGVQLLKLGVSKQNLSIIVALSGFQKII